MRKKTIYICECCGKESSNAEEIRKCEASHFGLTPDEKERWEIYKTIVKRRSADVFHSKNERTEKSYDEAIQELMEFEAQHHLNEEESNG